MPENTDAKLKQPVKAQDLLPPDVDASAVLSDHMYKFVYGPSPHLNEAVGQLAGQTVEMAKNAATLAGIERLSGNVRDDLQNRALKGAEAEQRKVVEMTNQLDMAALSQAIAGAAKGGRQSVTTLLKLAGATPLVERVRLGAIQMRQNSESDAEKTFEDAYRADIAKESKSLPEVVELKRAAQKMFEELKLRRTLPDVFDSKLTLIDTVVKDGALTREELLSAKKSTVNDGLTQTLIEYLLKNFDQMKNGDQSIDHKDVAAYHEKVMPKGSGI